jgi:WD40 repeat protein
VCTHRNATEAISQVKYSPDGSRLVTGSHDTTIDIYSCHKEYKLLHRCHGHSSYITHIDWSADSSLFQSNCGAHEILVWDAKSGRQAKQNQRDTRWAEWTCTLGFPVMGIFPNLRNGGDVECVCRSFRASDVARIAAPSVKDPLAACEGRFAVTGDGNGKVRMLVYPCVIDNAPSRTYTAHSSHVKNIQFAYDNRCDPRVILMCVPGACHACALRLQPQAMLTTPNARYGIFQSACC